MKKLPKRKQFAEAMHHAVGRAAIALEQKGQKLGALRYMSPDVKQVYGVATLETFATTTEIGGEWRVQGTEGGSSSDAVTANRKDHVSASGYSARFRFSKELIGHTSLGLHMGLCNATHMVDKLALSKKPAASGHKLKKEAVLSSSIEPQTIYSSR